MSTWPIFGLAVAAAAVFDLRHPVVAAVYDRRRRFAARADFDGHRPPLQTNFDGHRPPLQAKDRLARQASGASAFTLIEVMLASAMAAMILLAVYAVFSQAIKMRDHATQRMRDYQLRARASRTIRDDLRNAWISGGVLASVLAGSPTDSDGLDSAVPGYLKFTTTTGKDTADNLYGDVQQVEYYIAKDGSVGGATRSGKLVRVLTRDLLDSSSQQTETEELVLAGVQSLTVSFWDGSTWQTSWSFLSTAAANAANSNSSNTSSSSTSGSSSSASSGIGNSTVPEAIRIDIQQVAPAAKGGLPPPLTIEVPWTAQPFTPLPTPS